jgi:hypothetical protein
MSLNKTVRSRSNKEIGEIIEEKWEITAKTVIAEPFAGDRYRGIAPRLGIYDYEVKPIVQQVPVEPVAARKRKQNEPDVGGTRREASSVPLTVRR